MNKIIILIVAFAFLNSKTAFNQEAFKLNLKQPPLLIITISEELNATQGQIINLDTLFKITGYVSYTREWKFRDGSLLQTVNNPLLTLTKSGVFYLTVINENGCSVTDSIVFNLATDIEDVYNNMYQRLIHVYPNPNSGTFDIVISDCQPGFNVEVINSSGVRLLKKDLNCNNNEYSETIMIPSVESGTYFLLVKKENMIIYRQKIIILK